MLPPVKSRRALLRLFRKRPIVTLSTLLETLRTRSRMSVFRRLSVIDYLTSYSHAGRYYTLRAIPEFDEGGLWHHLGVSFSRYGSLKSTVEHIVNDSEAGKTHPELRPAPAHSPYPAARRFGVCIHEPRGGAPGSGRRGGQDGAGSGR